MFYGCYTCRIMESTEPVGRAQDAPEPPWHRSEPPPRALITRDAIIQAALVVLDREGMDGLSMRRVARRARDRGSSLYWHVRNERGAVPAGFRPRFPQDGATRTRPLPLEGTAPRTWAGDAPVLSRHRDVARISMGRMPAAPQIALFSE